MDHKRSRHRSHSMTAVSKEVHYASVISSQATVLQGGDLVEVEVEGEHNKGLPVVRGVNKRKRDPRGAGRRILQKSVSQHEGSVSVFVDSEDARASSDEVNETSGEIDESNNNADSDVFSSAATQMIAADTYVIVPDIMPQDKAVMKQLDIRRGSSRLRVKPSKFREGFLLSPVKARSGGDQKGAVDVTSSLEIVLPMEVQNKMPGASTLVNNAKMSSSRAFDRERSLHRPTLTSFGKNKFKFTYKSGAARAPDLLGPVAQSSSKGLDHYGLKTALAVLKRVMQIKSAEPFNEPVDPVVLGIPDYLDVIKEPMDLGTIRELLEGGKKYNNAQDVYSDVQLVWRNCRNYNQEGDPIMDILKIAENCFNKHWTAAGLHVVAPEPKTQGSNRRLESRGEVACAPDQHAGKETRRRKVKDSKVVAMLSTPKSIHFDTLNLRAKAKRSASVEQVMAESKAREDKLETEDKEVVKEDIYLSERITDDEVVEDEQTPQRIDNELQRQKAIEEALSGGQQVERELNSMKGNAEEAEVQNTKLVAKTSVQQKENTPRSSPSNKRRTSGNIYHKPECPCVVCVGLRRKLAREEKERLEGKESEKKKRKSHSLLQGNSDITKAAIVKVVRQPKSPRLQESVPTSTSTADAEMMVERVHIDFRIDNALDVETQVALLEVDGARYYPANYELPLRKVRPSFIHLGQALFANHSNTLWKRHHFLGCCSSPLMSKGSMLQAVDALRYNP